MESSQGQGKTKTPAGKEPAEGYRRKSAVTYSPTQLPMQPIGAAELSVLFVFKMKRVSACFRKQQHKTPASHKVRQGFYIKKIGGDLLSHTVAHADHRRSRALTVHFRVEMAPGTKKR